MRCQERQPFDEPEVHGAYHSAQGGKNSAGSAAESSRIVLYLEVGLAGKVLDLVLSRSELAILKHGHWVIGYGDGHDYRG